MGAPAGRTRTPPGQGEGQRRLWNAPAVQWDDLMLVLRSRIGVSRPSIPISPPSGRLGRALRHAVKSLHKHGHSWEHKIMSYYISRTINPALTERWQGLSTLHRRGDIDVGQDAKAFPLEGGSWGSSSDLTAFSAHETHR